MRFGRVEDRGRRLNPRGSGVSEAGHREKEDHSAQESHFPDVMKPTPYRFRKHDQSPAGKSKRNPHSEIVMRMLAVGQL